MLVVLLQSLQIVRFKAERFRFQICIVHAEHYDREVLYVVECGCMLSQCLYMFSYLWSKCVYFQYTAILQHNLVES